MGKTLKRIEVELEGGQTSVMMSLRFRDRTYKVHVRVTDPDSRGRSRGEDEVDDVIVHVSKPVLKGGKAVGARIANRMWHGDDVIWDRLSALGGSSSEGWWQFGATKHYPHVTNDPGDPYPDPSEEVLEQIAQDEAWMEGVFGKSGEPEVLLERSRQRVARMLKTE